MGEEKNQVLLFVSKDSIHFEATLGEFKELVSKLEEIQPFEQKVIDISEEPEMAEEYKIEVLPTLIVGDKKFTGKPEANKVLEAVKQ